MSLGWIYILHFEQPLHHARHYVGFSDANPDRRIRQHLDGTGRRPSPLVRAVIAAGIRVFVVACFRGSRDDERRIKDNAATSHRCPLCRADYNRRARDRMRTRRKLSALMRSGPPHCDCDCISCAPP